MESKVSSSAGISLHDVISTKLGCVALRQEITHVLTPICKRTKERNFTSDLQYIEF